MIFKIFDNWCGMGTASEDGLTDQSERATALHCKTSLTLLLQSTWVIALSSPLQNVLTRKVECFLFGFLGFFLLVCLSEKLSQDSYLLETACGWGSTCGTTRDKWTEAETKGDPENVSSPKSAECWRGLQDSAGIGKRRCKSIFLRSYETRRSRWHLDHFLCPYAGYFSTSFFNVCKITLW